jgi:hypothetical protein
VSDVVRAGDGVGQLIQRDYWAIIDDSRLGPSEVIGEVAARFWDFAPEELVTFAPVGDVGRRGLQVGDELEVDIRLAGRCSVRVVHRDACSLTLATLEGHPEAGRITFGAYRHQDGRVIFHIRSRARASTTGRLAGYRVIGEPMQTTTWTDFVERVAVAVGRGAADYVFEESQHDEDVDQDADDGPTFIARGD